MRIALQNGRLVCELGKTNDEGAKDVYNKWKEAEAKEEGRWGMEFRQLETFVLVVELGSFSEAAKKMRVTQPAISAQISSLEKEFGTKLVTRRPGRAVPSETGETLYTYAQQILALRDKAVASCARTSGTKGTLTIAASSIPNRFVLPVLTAEFRMKYPDVQFELVGTDSAGAVKAVLNGKADLGLTGTVPKDAGLAYEPFMEDELVVVAPATAPYTGIQGDVMEMESLLEFPFIIREPGSGTRTEIEAYLENQGLESGALNISAQMNFPDAIANAVAQGLGITIMSRLAATDYARGREMLIFKLAGRQARRKLYLVYPKDRKLNVLAMNFINFAARRSEG